MALWVVVTVLVGLAIVAVAAQVLRRIDAAAAAAGADEIAAALDRLSELERSAATGAIGGEEAETTRTAIRSWILAAVNQPRWAIPAAFAPHARKIARVAAASLLIVGLAGVYQRYDNPFEWSERPPSSAAPSASRPPEGTAAVEALAAAAGQAPSRSLPLQPQPEPQPTLGTVDEMVERLIERLDRNPSDVEGWRMLGWSYVNTDRHGPAVAAYAKAIALSPDDADLRSAYGEALVRRADGQVTDQARSALAAALRLDGRDARARFLMGLAKQQDGDPHAALADWIAILNEAESKESWFSDLQQRVAALGRELGIDVTARLHRDNAAVRVPGEQAVGAAGEAARGQ